MKKLKTIAALILFTALITGCATVASVKLVDKNKAPDGLILSMPYGLVKVTFDYELFKEEIWPADDQGNPKKTEDPETDYSITISNHVVESIIVPDQNIRFAFEPTDFYKFSKASDLELKFTNSSILESANFDVKDKTKEIVSGFVDTAINIGKTAVMLRGRTATELTSLGKDTFSAIIDLADLKWTQKENLYYYTAQKDFEIFPNLQNIEYYSPHIKIVFTSPKKLSGPSDDPVMNKKDTEIKGIPYRSGGALLIKTTLYYHKPKDDTKDDTLINVEKHIIDNYLVLPQLGPVGIMAFKSKPFSDSKQILTFSADSNILTYYKIENSSSGERLSSELASITSKIYTELETLKTSNPELFMTTEELSQKAELDELAHQLELYQAILAVEKEKAEIDKLKPASEETE